MDTIALFGHRRQGKTTFADALEVIEPNSVHLETSLVISDVVNEMHHALSRPILPHDYDAINTWFTELPNILNQYVHADVSFEQIAIDPADVTKRPELYEKLFAHLELLQHDFSLAQVDITPENKAAYVPALQWLGGYLVDKVEPGIWFNELASRAKTAEGMGKALCIISGGRFVSDERIMREIGATIWRAVRPDMPRLDANDPTEVEVDLITPDCILYNNGTVTAWRQLARRALNDYRAGQLKPDYKAIGAQSWYKPIS